MTPYWIHRFYWRVRSFEPKCFADRCPYPQISSLSKWCRAHTDAIMAGGSADADCEYARRVGARRWLLLAEVRVRRERDHVLVLEGILGQMEQERGFNRRLWDFPQPHVDPPMTERVDELLALREAS